MIVRRSKSSAILPLRKHLIEKTLQEQQQQQQAKKSVDEEQFYFQQKQQGQQRSELQQQARLMIKTIEEVMEEEGAAGGGRTSCDSMDVDDSISPVGRGSRSGSGGAESAASSSSSSSLVGSTLPPSFTARLGPSGLSPLVLSEVGGSISSEYVSKLLPRQPLELVASGAGALPVAADRTGLGYDPMVLRHHCTCGSDALHPENPSRVASILKRLSETGLVDQCVRVARRATLEEIRSVHSETHTLVYGTDMAARMQQGLAGAEDVSKKFGQLECGGLGVDSDTYWNEQETPSAVRTAVGSLVELSQRVSI